MLQLLRLLRDRRGANAIEYSLVAGLISIAALVAFHNLGDSIVSMYMNVSANLG